MVLKMTFERSNRFSKLVRSIIFLTLLPNALDGMSNGQRAVGPGSAGHPWNKDAELTPCQASALVREVRSGFGTVIPVFKPEILGIHLNTEDGGLTVRARDPSFSQFLLHYYALASKTINQLERENPRGRSAMLLTFNTNYWSFLDSYGLPLSCISFYAGKASVLGVTGVQDLAKKLQAHFRPRGPGIGQGGGPKRFGLVGQDMIRTLGLASSSFRLVPSNLPPGSYNPTCDPIFLKLQDGSTLTNLPSVTVPADTIKIPGQGPPIRTELVNVTYLLSQYLSTGIHCLESVSLQTKFTTSVSTWMETKLLPTLLGSSKCVNGFSGILNLINGLKFYSEGNPGKTLNGNPNIMGKDAKFAEVKTEDQFGGRLYAQYEGPQQYAQYPPPEFKNVYYPEASVADGLGGEYAPLQGAEPEVIENEIYKVSPRFQKYHLQGEELSTVKHGELTGPLMAGISVTAFLLLILICCMIPLLCFYCLKPKAFRRRQEKVKDWFRSLDEDESEPFLQKKSKGKCENKTKVNIRVNETSVAEVSITETDGGSEGESDEDSQDQGDQPAYFSEPNFEKPRRPKKCAKTDHRRQKRMKGNKVRKGSEDYAAGVQETRRDRRSSDPVPPPRNGDYAGVDTKRGRRSLDPLPPPLHWEQGRTKRHSLPRPTPADFRPPPAQVHSYEKRKSPVLVPTVPPIPEEEENGEQQHPKYGFLESSNESLLDPRPRRPSQTQEEEFYETNMVRWGSGSDETKR